MTVKEFYADFNRVLTGRCSVYMHDITSNTVRSDSLETFLSNEKLYTDWKNAILLSWSIDNNEFVLTVEKSKECC